MTYEILYIIPTRYTDAEIEEIQTKIRNLVEKVGGKTIKEENLGRIRLAYPIKQTRHGSYILSYLEGEPSIINELENQLRLTEEILRFMIVQKPKGIPERLFSLESYVAPLSEEDEEAKKQRRPSSPQTEWSKPSAPMAAPIKVEPTIREEKPLSLEELDQKLDKILSADLTEKI